MPDEPRVQELLAELLDQQADPEEVCGACPELLPVVRKRWQQICRTRAELDALLPIWPTESLSTTTTTEELPLPQIPGFEVESVLGRGGMGIVYKARQVGLDRFVALKMIRYAEDAGPQEQARFRAEARANARLLHPGIVQIHEVGECQGRAYFALEYCPGGSLDKHLDGTPWEPKRAARLVEALAEAVAAAHRAGIVHRDLKPGNVLLAADGTPKVTDFGLARRLDGSGRTRTGTILGTPAYMAPEQSEGQGKQAGPAADVWALGVILYELLTGRPPFKAVTDLQTLQHVASREPVSVRHLQPAVPRDLETICHHCLEKDTKRRYESAEALAEDLRRFGSGEPVTARPVGRLVRLLKWTRRRPAAAALIVLSVLTLAGLMAGTLMIAWQDRQLAKRTEQQLDALVTVGERDLQAGRFDAAIASLTAASALRPTDARAGDLLLQAKVGQLLMTAKANDSPDNAAAALQALDKLLELDRDHAEARALKAKVTGYEYLLDSTGLGFSTAQVRRLQEIWARRLGCEVEETVEVAAGVKMTLVLIPPGKFRMGSPAEEKERDADESLHEVTLTEPFYLGKTEVTQAQYEALIGKNPSQFKGADRPVESVTWGEARDYTERLTKKRSDGLVYRLPTEAEWEYACRGGRPSAQPFGVGDGRALSSAEANFDGAFPYGGGAKGKSRQSTCRVGSYPANALGLHDLHGNVYEWCADWYAEYPAGDVTNPRGPSGGSSGRSSGRVVRGGGWGYQGTYCRAADRGENVPSKRDRNLGFRVAAVPSGSSPQGKLEDVRAAWEKNLELDPPDHAFWHGYAELCLFLGREEDYRRARRALLKRFGATTHSIDAEQTARACLLLPGTDDELRQAVVLAERAVADREVDKWTHPFFEFVRGLAEYRLGHFDRAIAKMQGDASGVLGPAPGLVLALSLHLSGQATEARKTLAAAILAHDWRATQVHAPDQQDGWIHHILRREAEAMILPKLQAFRQGNWQPQDNDERLALLGICEFEARYGTASRLCADAFAADPGLAERLTTQFLRRAAQESDKSNRTKALITEIRYRAARCAALASCGLGKDEAKLSEAERAHWRRRALEWLRADLVVLSRTLDSGLREDGDIVKEMLTLWQEEPNLAGLREPARLEKLAEDERKGCHDLWAEVRAVLARCGNTP